ncbi:MAG: glycine cleavage system protein GcvH [bacterium]
MATIEGYNFPDDLYYHKEHSWAKVEDDGTVRVGMNEFFCREAGDVVYIDLPFEGDEFKQGETCGKLQSSKWIGKLFAPISGEVVEVNQDLDSDSTLINKDPYGEGWILKIQPSNLDEELGNLMKGDAVKDWLKGEIERAERERSK